MIRVRFIQQFDWPFTDPYCNCRKLVSYKTEWSGSIKDEIALAAIAAGKAERVDEPASDEIHTPDGD